jgi:demethylmenaquinone methyltransferase/2-methoxy-6-polyprenyl-1,4-benzoquinol methylase
MAEEHTHFGYQTVAESEKAAKVAQVFHSVASRYDVMNDLMSAGLHRVWKAFTIGRAAVRPGMKVLDIAGGTGDLARTFAKQAGPTGEVWLTDINHSMLRVGRDRLLDDGVVLPCAVCDGHRAATLDLLTYQVAHGAARCPKHEALERLAHLHTTHLGVGSTYVTKNC